MSVIDVLSLFGGLAMFLYGMQLMGDGLKKSSGGAFKKALEMVTNNRILGFLLGVLVTCMIQSSHATIVLVVGLVGAGLLSFKQSIAIVLGANVGTTITAQIIRLIDVDAGSGTSGINMLLNFFKPATLTSIAAIIGIVLVMFFKKKSTGGASTIAMGFAVLFTGLLGMSSAVSGLSESQGFINLITTFSDVPILGFITGTVVTCIIQSSSAAVGIIQALCSSTGAITFSAIYAVIIGINIGNCITTYLICRIGAKPDQIRTVTVHVIFNVLGAIIIAIGVLLAHYMGWIDWLWDKILDSGDIANIHTLFKLSTAVMLLPFSGLFEKAAYRLVKDSHVSPENAEIEENIKALDERLLTNPALALSQTEHVIGHMAAEALKNYDAAMGILENYDSAVVDRMNEREDLIDRMADATNRYLVALSPYISKDADNRRQGFLLKALTSFERIGDLAMNILDNVERLKQDGGKFTEKSINEIKLAADAVRKVLVLASDAFYNNSDKVAKNVEPLEEVVDDIVEILKERIIERMKDENNSMMTSIQYQNILQQLERVSDQCSDLAVYMLSCNNNYIEGNEHQYLHEIHRTSDPEYWEYFRINHDKYISRLKAI